VSLRLRLTLLNGVVLLLVLGAFAGVAYATQARALDASLDTSLREQAQRFTDNALTWFDPRLRRPREGRLPRFQPAPGGDALIQVVGSDGDVESRSGSLGGATLPVDPDLVRRATSGQGTYADVQLNGQSVREYIAPVRLGANGPIVAAIQVGRSTRSVQDSLGSLQATLLGVGVIGVLVSLFAGWLLARAALQPIDGLAAAAHAIGSARDFSRRVANSRRAARRDEIGRLTAEFDGMLGQLQAAHTQLQETLAAQRRFIADASHELRTPLSVVRGNLDLLALGGADADEIAALLNDARGETERMGRLVGDLLLLAQADAGQHLTLRPVAIAPVLHDAFRAARFFREGVSLSLGPIPEDVTVEGDADRLKQVALILLDNALKFTPEGGSVRLDALTEAEGDCVTVRVTDTGPGIPWSDRARIFERFVRLDSQRGSRGAGLGLPIARWIVEEHGGSIEIADIRDGGGGARICVRLPVLSSPSVARAAAVVPRELALAQHN
jgi:two-component system OmpR family sensor kinase